MTNEEIELTIDYLKSIQEGYIEGECYERHPLPEWYALDKAIKALEQQTTTMNEVLDYIGAMNMCDEISNEAYKKISTHFADVMLVNSDWGDMEVG